MVLTFRRPCSTPPTFSVNTLFVSRVPAALVVWSCIVRKGGGEVVGVPRVVSKYLPGRGAALGARALYDMQKPAGKW